MVSGVDDSGGVRRGVGGGGPAPRGVGGGGPAAHVVGGGGGVPPPAGLGGGLLLHGVGGAGAPAPAGGGGAVADLAAPPEVQQQGVPPAAHQQGGAAAGHAPAVRATAATAAVREKGKGAFEDIVSRYINKDMHPHLELYLKTLMQSAAHEDTPELEHVAVILNCRMAHVAYIAKNQGYESAFGYFEDHIKPLMSSQSPFGNHENIMATINRIQTSLKEHKPVLFETDDLKLSICDYIRFYLPKQACYPASLGLRSQFYEFVFPMFPLSQGKYRCLLCQSVWTSKPNTFLHKHFKGKQVCPNQTQHSRERYEEFTRLTAKRKADSPASSNLKLKEIRLEQIEEDAEMETENLDMQQLITRGRACIRNLDEPFVQQDHEAFIQIQNEMRQVFLSMEKTLESQNSGQAGDLENTDPQESALHSAVYAATEDLPGSSNRGCHLPSDTDMNTGPSLQFQPSSNEYSNMSLDEISLFLSQDLNTETWSPEPGWFSEALPVNENDTAALGDGVVAREPWDESYARIELLSNQNNTAAPGDGADGAQAVHGQEVQQVPAGQEAQQVTGEGEPMQDEFLKELTDFLDS